MSDILDFLRRTTNIFSAVQYLPSILREAGSLLGIFALIAILLALIVVFLFRNAETKQKERIFLYTALFLLTLVFSSLIAGASTGFETGREYAITQRREDPAVVTLDARTAQALERYLAENGQRATDETRARVLSNALGAYLTEPKAENSSPLIAIDSGTDGEMILPERKPSVDSVPDGFSIDDKSCSQRNQTLTCDLLITNLDEGLQLTVFGTWPFKSRIVDGEGNPYNAADVSIAQKKSNMYLEENFIQDVPVKVSLTFTNVLSSADEVEFLQLFASTIGYPKSDISFKVRNIPITD